MRLTSNDLMACPDSCISDAGANCLICERLAETKFISMLMNDKFYLVLKEAEEIKYAEDYILEKKLEVVNQSLNKFKQNIEETITLVALDGEVIQYTSTPHCNIK